jgi:hypothetical protein
VRKRQCVVVGFDGFDPDVLANLLLFYGACGFEVGISRAPVDCDLLVVQRGRYNNAVFDVHAGECHIYDYAAMGSSDFHLAFPNVSTCVVIASGPRASGNTIPQHLVQSFHPVIPALWTADTVERSGRSYDFVHIGHRKPNEASDGSLEQMDVVARSGRCHFWGLGWKDIVAPGSSTAHGHASLHDCQRIYRRAKFAFGVMYPFQRQKTISGRMWQAPLNGCMVFSEATIPGVSLPGVQVCHDYLHATMHPHPLLDPLALVSEAVDYWSGVTGRLASNLGLNYKPPGRWHITQVYLKWIYLRHLKTQLERIFLRGNPT